MSCIFGEYIALEAVLMQWCHPAKIGKPRKAHCEGKTFIHNKLSSSTSSSQMTWISYVSFLPTDQHKVEYMKDINSVDI